MAGIESKQEQRRKRQRSCSLLQEFLGHLEQVDWRFCAGAADRPVTRFLQPDQLIDEFGDSLQLKEEAIGQSQLLEAMKKVYELSVTSAHPHFYNQLFGRPGEESVAGSLLTDVINTSIYTFEVAPVLITMEKLVGKRLLKLFGFEDGEVIGCPGGSIGNMYALSMARHSRFPEVRKKGVAAMPAVRIYASAESHYSFVKGAGFMGFGEESVVKMGTDSTGHMLVNELRDTVKKDKEQGLLPFFVVATAGTTVFGAFDDLEGIADVCQEFGVYLHVDACLGGSLVLSDTHAHRLKGCHRADSVTWNPHKMLNVNLQCSFLITKHPGSLQESHGLQAAYLFQKDKCYDVSYDIGDSVIQCGRKVDILKFWCAWQGLGRRGLGQLVDAKLRLATRLADRLRQQPDRFEVLAEPECTNVVFWYFPPCLRGQERTDDWWQRLDSSAPLIKQEMMRRGTMLMGHQRTAHSRGINCWRMVCSQESNTREDIEFIVGEFERLGQLISV